MRAIAVNANGDAWFATDKGAGVIELRPMTLTGKAKFFEDEIDKRHRRTEYGYIYYAHLRSPGDTSVEPVKTMNINFTYLAAANLKFMLEYNKSDQAGANGFGTNKSINTVLRAAF